MSVISAIAWGSASILFMELLITGRRVGDWLFSRRIRGSGVRWTSFIDPVPDLLAALTRVILGATAASLLASTGQIAGPGGAIAAGISPPLLLMLVGRIGLPRDATRGADARGPSLEEGIPPGELDAYLKSGEHELRKLDAPSARSSKGGELA
ncbi:hypothetical protein GCM10009738_52710 [Kitasatospora viridis]